MFVADGGDSDAIVASYERAEACLASMVGILSASGSLHEQGTAEEFL